MVQAGDSKKRNKFDPTECIITYNKMSMKMSLKNKLLEQ